MHYMKILALLLFPFSGFSQIKLEPKTIFDEEIELSIPVGLERTDNPLSEIGGDEWLYVNSDKSVFFSISYPSNRLNTNQLHAYRNFLINGLKEDFPGIIISDSDVVEINERKIGFIECHQTIANKIVCTSIYFTSVKGRVFKVSLEYEKDLQDQWKNICREIIGTLKIL